MKNLRTGIFKLHRFSGLLFVVIIAAAGSSLLLFSHAATDTVSIEPETGTTSSTVLKLSDATASGSGAVKFTAPSVTASCVLTSVLENPCRPWLATSAGAYSQVASDDKSQDLYHEQRIRRQVDFVHTYHSVGSNQLSATDTYFATRPGTFLITNWKPAAVWADADGGNASINAGIDQMAASIKSLGSTKIILSVFHEPENDVSSGAPNCGNIYVGSAGTPSQYVAMWSNVEARFKAAGVSNVVWAMNYMGFSKWNCMVKDLWPGNNLVDWVLYDPYVTSDGVTYNGAVSSLYTYMSNNSDASHAFTSKPWGLNEWNIYNNVSEANRLTAFNDIKNAIDNNTYPRLKLYDVFDKINGGDYRVGCVANLNATCTIDQTSQNAYNAFANDPKMTGSWSY
jgi:hypothetical protein